MTRLGEASLVLAWSGNARQEWQGELRSVAFWLGGVRHGPVRQGMAGMLGSGLAGLGVAWNR